jgi:protein SCO1/2
MTAKKSTKSEKMTNPPKKKSKAGAEAETAEAEAPATMPSRRNVYIALMVLISVFIVVWRYYIEPAYFTEYRAPAGGQGAQVSSVGMPEIGGPFSLVNQDGKSVSQADFTGRYMLIYFGYTYCPDVCPTALSAMGNALDILGSKGDIITPVFITVDPERDDANALKMYVEHFHPRLVGLTGSPDQVKAAAKAYKAYFAKVGDGYNDGTYAMDHSSITYLMGPDGKFVTHFGHGVDGEQMARKIAEIL